jgi:dynein heavy chain
MGNTSKLVITPQTDRCFRAICTAIHFNNGAVLSGLAGVGKTETIKDLAKAFASHCIVFNCIDGLDYRVIAQLFKGIVSSASWICFDQFNNTNL